MNTDSDVLGLSEDAIAASQGLDSRFPRHRLLYPVIAGACAPGELAHDIWHVMRVYSWAMKLALVGGAEPDLAGAAALVHDLVPIPKDSALRSQGGEQSAAAAQPLLRQVGYATADVETVVSAVQTSSWSRGLPPTNAVGVVLQDADRLDAIGSIGVMRCIATAQHMSKPHRPGRFYNPLDPLAQESRTLNDRRQALDHFRAKLLKLCEGLHLPLAQAEGRRRHDAMLSFMEHLGREIREC